MKSSTYKLVYAYQATKATLSNIYLLVMCYHQLIYHRSCPPSHHTFLLKPIKPCTNTPTDCELMVAHPFHCYRIDGHCPACTKKRAKVDSIIKSVKDELLEMRARVDELIEQSANLKLMNV